MLGVLEPSARVADPMTSCDVAERGYVAHLASYPPRGTTRQPGPSARGPLVMCIGAPDRADQPIAVEPTPGPWTRWHRPSPTRPAGRRSPFQSLD